MNAYPLYIRPLIGFAQWHYSRDETTADVLSRIQAHSQYSRFTPDEINQAMEMALYGDYASRKIQLLGHQATIRDAMPTGVRPADCVGARVSAIVRDSNGQERNISMTLNVTPDMSAQGILDSARVVAESGMIQRRKRGSDFEEVLTMGLSQIVLDSFDDPTADLC